MKTQELIDWIEGGARAPLQAPNSMEIYMQEPNASGLRSIYCAFPGATYLRFLVAVLDTNSGTVLGVGSTGLFDGEHERYAPSPAYLTDAERRAFMPTLAEQYEDVVRDAAATECVIADDTIADDDDARRVYAEVFPDAGDVDITALGEYRNRGDVLFVWTREGFNEDDWRTLMRHYTPEVTPLPRTVPPVTGPMARPKRNA